MMNAWFLSKGIAARRRAAAFLVLLLIGCAGAGRPPEGERPAGIRIVGSDTMEPLARRWAEEYMRAHPDMPVYTGGGGSRRGIEALIEGDADLSAASRIMRPDEVKRLLDRRGFLGLSILTAKDALSVYLHQENPVRDLSLEDLKRIFTGEAREWSQFGGPPEPIRVINRQPNSGTHLFFRQHVLEMEEYREDATTAASASAVIREVAADPWAIGYGGIAYGPGLTHCRVDGVPPTAENVRNGTYPLARYLYLYAAGPLEGRIKRFVDWVLSDEGQRVVAEVGYIPLWEVAVQGKD